MKMRKTLTALIITAVFAVTCSGCGQIAMPSLPSESTDKKESSYSDTVSSDTQNDNVESDSNESAPSETKKPETDESKPETTTTKAPETEKPARDNYSVSISIECEENLAFSRYDVDVYVDGKHIGTMDHGIKKTFDLTLKGGKHEITFTKEGDTSIDGSTDVTISDDCVYSILIHCRKDQVKIKEVNNG